MSAGLDTTLGRGPSGLERLEASLAQSPAGQLVETEVVHTPVQLVPEIETPKEHSPKKNNDAVQIEPETRPPWEAQSVQNDESMNSPIPAHLDESAKMGTQAESGDQLAEKSSDVGGDFHQVEPPANAQGSDEASSTNEAFNSEQIEPNTGADEASGSGLKSRPDGDGTYDDLSGGPPKPRPVDSLRPLAVKPRTPLAISEDEVRPF